MIYISFYVHNLVKNWSVFLTFMLSHIIPILHLAGRAAPPLQLQLPCESNYSNFGQMLQY